jgi:hypothetical protein
MIAKLPFGNAFVRAAVALTLLASSAAASTISFTGSDATHAFSASFSVVGSNLQITLLNTESSGAAVNSIDVLGAIYFNISGNTALTPLAAALGSGSSYVNDPSHTAVLGQDWQYLSTLSAAVTPNGQRQGISAVGYGIFGPSGNFCTSGCNNLGGIDFGLVPTSYVAGTGSGIGSSRVVIDNSVVFTLSGIPVGFDPNASISNVEVQYGSATSDDQLKGNKVSTPEPSTIVFGACGLAGLALARRRRAQ